MGRGAITEAIAAFGIPSQQSLTLLDCQLLPTPRSSFGTWRVLSLLKHDWFPWPEAGRGRANPPCSLASADVTQRAGRADRKVRMRDGRIPQRPGDPRASRRAPRLSQPLPGRERGRWVRALWRRPARRDRGRARPRERGGKGAGVGGGGGGSGSPRAARGPRPSAGRLRGGPAPPGVLTCCALSGRPSSAAGSPLARRWLAA